MLINFVSNLPRDLRSGGFSALNAVACEAISKSNSVNYAGPTNPPPNLRQKLISKALRVARMPGDFAFFSELRLGEIASLVTANCDPGAALDFFHGFTPWIATKPTRPYVTLSDCSFRDYIAHYHRRADFRRADLERIERREAVWLQNAAAVAFTSRWAAERTTRDYALDPARVGVVGIFGEVELPESDAFSGGQQFAFISTDFAAKGGPTLLAAFNKLREQHPRARLIIVGDTPVGVTDGNGITIAGYLRKHDAAENQRLREILSSSRALVHPTMSDISPHVLVEAGYFGCPVISTRKFAIEEIVRQDETGLLVDDARDVADIATAMAWMLEVDEARYLAMRKAAWVHSRNSLTKDLFERRLLALVDSALNQSP
jgi:glycosyltransferase involved in cell wall biosynthesis